MERLLQGSCLCGTVHYEVTDLRITDGLPQHPEFP
jgi:hypothetical protein